MSTNEQAPAPVAGDEISRPASEQPVEAIGAGREEALRRLTVLRDQARNGTPVTDPNEWEADELDAILAALSPASPARTPMGGDREHSSRCWGRTSFSDEVLHCYCQTAPTPMGGEDIGEEYDVAAHCVTLAECPPGLFFWNGTIGFKSEYGAMEPAGDGGKAWRVGNRPDAYCADSGEFFWGGSSTHEDRAKVLVMPINAQTVAMVASHGPEALAKSTPMGREVEALREALIQADLKIRSLPGTDQSDVEFIRQALAAPSPPPAQGGAA